MAKFHQWFQTLALPFVGASFHIYFGLRVIGRENLPEGGCVVRPIIHKILTHRLQRLPSPIVIK